MDNVQHERLSDFSESRIFWLRGKDRMLRIRRSALPLRRQLDPLAIRGSTGASHFTLAPLQVQVLSSIYGIKRRWLSPPSLIPWLRGKDLNLRPPDYFLIAVYPSMDTCSPTSFLGKCISLPWVLPTVFISCSSNPFIVMFALNFDGGILSVG